MARAEATYARLRRTALQMFCEQGYDAVTVAQIASAAGVSHMTFFRHFPTKEAVVVADLFDPVISAAITAQPREWAPLNRAVRGFLAAMTDHAARDELNSVEFRQRVGLAAATPSLRGAVWAGSQATEEAITEALTQPSVTPTAARAGAAAVMGAATSILLAWARLPGDPETARAATPDAALREGLLSLIGEPHGDLA